jgi:putative oxidoreductase
MKILTKTIARFLFAIPFLVFGVFHFMNLEAMAGMVPSFLPFGQVWVGLTGLALIGASISIMTAKWDFWASFLLGVMLLIFAIFIHLMAVMDGNEASMSSLLKDTALAGAAWLYAGFIAKNKSF